MGAEPHVADQLGEPVEAWFPRGVEQPEGMDVGHALGFVGGDGRERPRVASELAWVQLDLSDPYSGAPAASAAGGVATAGRFDGELAPALSRHLAADQQ